MEKCLNSAIATLFVALLFLVYILPYYAPDTLAQPIGNGSSIINGSISGIPSGVKVTLFIVDKNDNMVTLPIQGITSSQNTFSTPAMPPINANDGDIIKFKINGKDTGTTIVFHSGTTMTVQLTYTPPGSSYTLTNPATPVPFKINASATPTATDSPLPPSVTPEPISNTPTVTAASPSPTATFPVNTVIIAILIGIVLLAVVIVFLRKK